MYRLYVRAEQLSVHGEHLDFTLKCRTDHGEPVHRAANGLCYTKTTSLIGRRQDWAATTEDRS